MSTKDKKKSSDWFDFIFDGLGEIIIKLVRIIGKGIFKGVVAFINRRKKENEEEDNGLTVHCRKIAKEHKWSRSYGNRK